MPESIRVVPVVAARSGAGAARDPWGTTRASPYALPTSVNHQPFLTRSHGPRGNALPDAPASCRRSVRVGSSRHRGASENTRFKDTMEMRTNSGPQAYGLCIALDTGNLASNAWLCRKGPRIGLGGTTQERRGRHSHGDCGNEKTRVPPASDLWVMHRASPWGRDVREKRRPPSPERAKHRRVCRALSGLEIHYVPTAPTGRRPGLNCSTPLGSRSTTAIALVKA